MRLPEHKIKEAILHPDPEIRDRRTGSGQRQAQTPSPNVLPNVPLGASRSPVLGSRQRARGGAKTPWVRSRAPAGLPKLGVAGSNPVRRSPFLLWESLPASI